MHTHTHTQTHNHTHKQDTFLVLFTTTSTSGKRGIIMVWTDADYWLRGAESPTSDGGNSWRQRKKRGTAGKPATGPRTMRWPTHWVWAPHSVLTPGQRALKTLYFPPARHFREYCSLIDGISRQHRTDFYHNTLCTLQWRTTVVAWAKTHQQPVNQNIKVPVSCRGRRWKAEKTHLGNGSTCVMLVNNDNTVEVAGEESQKLLFTPLQENSPAVQLS